MLDIQYIYIYKYKYTIREHGKLRMMRNMNDENNQTAPCVDFDDNDDDDDVDDDDSDSDHPSHYRYYTHTVEAIKTKTGLDVGYKVTWPKRNSCIPPQELSCGIDHSIIHPVKNGDDSDENNNNVILELSTQLPSDCIAPMFHGTQWAGTTIWRSAVVALQYLLYYHDGDRNQSHSNNLALATTSAKSNDSGIQFDPSMTLLELGCGLGVPGMVLHAMTGCRTILTDKDDLVSQLQKNIATNFYNGAKDGNRNDSDRPDPNFPMERRIEAHALDWSIDGVTELLKRCQNTSSSSSTIHVVLACDCIYEPLYGDSWRNLLSVQNELLRLYPQAYVLTACHRRPCDGIDAYLAEAIQQPHLSHTEKLHIPFAHSSVVELYRLHGLTYE